MPLKSVKFTSTLGLPVSQEAGVGGSEGLSLAGIFLNKSPAYFQRLTLSAKQHWAMAPRSGAAAHPSWFLGAAHRTHCKAVYFEVPALLRLNNVKLHNPRAGLLASYFKSLII